MCGYSIFLGKSLSYDKFKQLYLNSNIVDRGGSGDNFDNPKQGCYIGHSLFHVTSKIPVYQPIKSQNGFLLFNGEISSPLIIPYVKTPVLKPAAAVAAI